MAPACRAWVAGHRSIVPWRSATNELSNPYHKTEPPASREVRARAGPRLPQPSVFSREKRLMFNRPMPLRTTRPLLEPLEDRSCPTTVSFANGVLTITGDNNANKVTITQDDKANTLVVKCDSWPYWHRGV